MLRYLVDPVTDEPEASTVHHSRNGASLAFSFPTAPRGQTVVMFIDACSVIDAARRDPESVWQRTLAKHPLMHARYAGATEMEPVRFHDDHMSYFRPATGPGWALIGDAGHFKNPIIGQGIRDALWAGRTMAEQSGGLLERPAELDVALRKWEQERERECRLAYLSGLMEARTMGDSAGILDLVAALDRHQVRIVDAFGRRGPGLWHRYPKGAILRAAVDAVRESRAPARTLVDLGEAAFDFAARAVALHRQPFRGRTPNRWEIPIPADHRPADVA
jgi:2-polyprenyl-6-methoxyphenol hydroxylase-like FAD-dependent oxidoreductase